MGWRVVRVSGRAKLDYKMNYLVCRKCNDTLRVFLDEISILIIESTCVSITTALLVKLTKQKIKVIFCDEQRMPYFEMMPYYGSHDTSRKVLDQMKWTDYNRYLVWTSIVFKKIANQARILKDSQKDEYLKLYNYMDEMEFNDENNREGHAAKVYFNALFGNEFSRDKECPINAALNYGYTLLLSTVLREIVAMGYITQLGIHHHNIFNEYNLGSDLVEPLRIFVDRFVLENDIKKFDKEEKAMLTNILVEQVVCGNKKRTMLDAIEIYVRSVIKAIETGDPATILFVEELRDYEL